MISEKKAERWARETEKSVHDKLSKVSGADTKTIAATQAEVAADIMRDTESVDLAPVVSPEEVYQGQKQEPNAVVDGMRRQFYENHQLIKRDHPDHAEGQRKSWAVGINLKKS